MVDEGAPVRHKGIRRRFAPQNPPRGIGGGFSLWDGRVTITPTPRLRGRAAVAQRDRRLQRTNYLCELCLPDRVTLANVVDHIIPLAHGGPDTDENTRNLCDDHHRQVTAGQFGHQYREHKTIGPDGWPAQ